MCWLLAVKLLLNLLIYYRYLTHAIIRMFVFFFSFAKLKYFSLDYSHLLPCHHNRHLRMFNLTQVLCQMFFLMQPHILLHGNDVLLWFSLGVLAILNLLCDFSHIVWDIYNLYDLSEKKNSFDMRFLNNRSPVINGCGFSYLIFQLFLTD